MNLRFYWKLTRLICLDIWLLSHSSCIFNISLIFTTVGIICVIQCSRNRTHQFHFLIGNTCCCAVKCSLSCFCKFSEMKASEAVCIFSVGLTLSESFMKHICRVLNVLKGMQLCYRISFAEHNRIDYWLLIAAHISRTCCHEKMLNVVVCCFSQGNAAIIGLFNSYTATPRDYSWAHPLQPLLRPSVLILYFQRIPCISRSNIVQ